MGLGLMDVDDSGHGASQLDLVTRISLAFARRTASACPQAPDPALRLLEQSSERHPFRSQSYTPTPSHP